MVINWLWTSIFIHCTHLGQVMNYRELWNFCVSELLFFLPFLLKLSFERSRGRGGLPKFIIFIIWAIAVIKFACDRNSPTDRNEITPFYGSRQWNIPKIGPSHPILKYSYMFVVLPSHQQVWSVKLGTTLQVQIWWRLRGKEGEGT